MIESKFTFLQMEIESRRAHPPKTSQTGFGESPEFFDSIDMGGTKNKLVFPMIHSEVFPVPDVDEAMIASPTIGDDDALQGHFSTNDSLKSVFGAIWNDLGIDFSVSFEKAKKMVFPKAPWSRFPLTRGALKGFIYFELSGQRRLRFIILDDSLPGSFQKTVNGIAIQTCQNSDLSGI